MKNLPMLCSLTGVGGMEPVEKFSRLRWAAEDISWLLQWCLSTDLSAPFAFAGLPDTMEKKAEDHDSLQHSRGVEANKLWYIQHNASPASPPLSQSNHICGFNQRTVYSLHRISQANIRVPGSLLAGDQDLHANCPSVENLTAHCFPLSPIKSQAKLKPKESQHHITIVLFIPIFSSWLPLKSHTFWYNIHNVFYFIFFLGSFLTCSNSQLF